MKRLGKILVVILVLGMLGSCFGDSTEEKDTSSNITNESTSERGITKGNSKNEQGEPAAVELPLVEVTIAPTEVPKATATPTPEPTEAPTAEPTAAPTPKPTKEPTPEPISEVVSGTLVNGTSDSSGAQGNSDRVMTGNEATGGGTSVIVPKEEDTVGNLVWVPTNGGKKYHRKSSCSKMIDPMQVTVEHAEQNGYTPCGKCY